ncbi:hypothetical protein EVAR_83347_1 [Eumeta japonica]|uniref:Uncharacterized protein n=1 Tax=Eumeta variegata TaxID=151549 RepID=A0A4C1VUL2_EUMVA|nr:hypothetical protein EVAR_83347_1 [Eumeta japonica]
MSRRDMRHEKQRLYYTITNLSAHLEIQLRPGDATPWATSVANKPRKQGAVRSAVTANLHRQAPQLTIDGDPQFESIKAVVMISIARNVFSCRQLFSDTSGPSSPCNETQVCEINYILFSITINATECSIKVSSQKGLWRRTRRAVYEFRVKHTKGVKVYRESAPAPTLGRPTARAAADGNLRWPTTNIVLLTLTADNANRCCCGERTLNYRYRAMVALRFAHTAFQTEANSRVLQTSYLEKLVTINVSIMLALESAVSSVWTWSKFQDFYIGLSPARDFALNLGFDHDFRSGFDLDSNFDSDSAFRPTPSSSAARRRQIESHCISAPRSALISLNSNTRNELAERPMNNKRSPCSIAGLESSRSVVRAVSAAGVYLTAVTPPRHQGSVTRAIDRDSQITGALSTRICFVSNYHLDVDVRVAFGSTSHEGDRQTAIQPFRLRDGHGANDKETRPARALTSTVNGDAGTIDIRLRPGTRLLLLLSCRMSPSPEACPVFFSSFHIQVLEPFPLANYRWKAANTHGGREGAARMCNSTPLVLCLREENTRKKMYKLNVYQYAPPEYNCACASANTRYR